MYNWKDFGVQIISSRLHLFGSEDIPHPAYDVCIPSNLRVVRCRVDENEELVPDETSSQADATKQ